MKPNQESKEPLKKRAIEKEGDELSVGIVKVVDGKLEIDKDLPFGT